MRTEYLKTFYAIVEFGSFSKASEQTFLTKQALMNQISTLENELGFPLLIHSNNGMRLTEPGRRFYTFSLKWYKELEQIIDSCRESVNVRHQIRIANPPLPFLEHEALIDAFREDNPDIDIKIIYYQDDEHKPLEGLLYGTYDICTINLDYFHNDVRGVSYTPIDSSYDLYCLVAKNHPLASRESLTLEDVADYKVGIRQFTNKEDLKECLHKINPKIKIYENTFNEIEFIINFCYEGGCYLSKAYFAPLIQSVAAIPIPEVKPGKPAIFYAAKHASHIEKFISFAKLFYNHNIPNQ